MRKQKRFDQINVIPYVDVLLVLLLVFMVAAPMMHQKLSVDLPYESEKLSTMHEQAWRLVIDKKGNYQIAKSNQSLVAVSAKELPKKIMVMTRGLSKNPSIQIEADKNTDYQHVVTALVALQKQGVSQINFIYRS